MNATFGIQDNLTDTTLLMVGYANYSDYEKVWVRISIK